MTKLNGFNGMINVLYRFNDEKANEIKEGFIWVGDKTALEEGGYEEGNHIDDEILFFARDLGEVESMMMTVDDEIIIEWYEHNPLSKLADKEITLIKMLGMEIVSRGDTDPPEEILDFIRLSNAEYRVRQGIDDIEEDGFHELDTFYNWVYSDQS